MRKRTRLGLVLTMAVLVFGSYQIGYYLGYGQALVDRAEEANAIYEDEIGWNCMTMGNQECGPEYVSTFIGDLFCKTNGENTACENGWVEVTASEDRWSDPSGLPFCEEGDPIYPCLLSAIDGGQFTWSRTLIEVASDEARYLCERRSDDYLTDCHHID